MGEYCRICYRPLTTYGVPSDPLTCDTCRQIGTDQSDAKSMSTIGATIHDTTITGTIASLSPDLPTETTPQGGRHSAIGVALHQLDPALMLALGKVLYSGTQKYGRNNWRDISVEDHINHALNHIWGHALGDDQDDHMVHAILRLMFAWVVDAEGGPYRADN